MDIYKLCLIVENVALGLVVLYIVLSTISVSKILNCFSRFHGNVMDNLEKEKKKGHRARELYANGYMPLKFEDDYFICSSLYPDGSMPGKMREYKFPLIPDENEHLVVKIVGDD